MRITKKELKFFLNGEREMYVKWTWCPQISALLKYAEEAAKSWRIEFFVFRPQLIRLKFRLVLFKTAAAKLQTYTALSNLTYH